MMKAEDSRQQNDVKEVELLVGSGFKRFFLENAE